MIIWKTECNTCRGIKTDQRLWKLAQGTPRVSFRTFLVSKLYQWYTWFCENNNQIAMFADDTSPVKAGKRKKCQIQEDIDKMAGWFTSNRLIVNASKREVLSFGLGGQKRITLMNRKIPQKTSCRYLGLHIDGKITFRDHIDYVVKKLNQFSGLVYKLRHLYPSKHLLSI